MSTKHTPGPWAFAPDSSGVGTHGSIWGNDQESVCVAEVVDDGEMGAIELTANARLITAAPDMLAALDAIACHSSCPPSLFAIACAAIAKADGGNQ